MADKAINMKAHEIRALLEGRKTQHRMVIRPQPEPTRGMFSWDGRKSSFFCGADGLTEAMIKHRAIQFCTGDRLWVREAFQTGWPLNDDDVPDQYDEDGNEKPETIWYRATRDINRWIDESGNHRDVPWLSSSQMTRRASRLTLIVTDVRLQRLNDITRGDAMAEGCPFPNMQAGPDPRDWFRDLWASLHGPDAWGANPWVAAYTFTLHRCNIDQLEAQG